MVDKSLDSNIVVTLGGQLLPRNFKILIFSSPLSNVFPKPNKMFYNMCKSFMHITYDFSLLHPEELILLDQCMFLS